MVKTWTYKELDEKYGKLCKRYNSVCYDKQRLKAQLDREIHINRIMKNALKKYADMSNWFICYLRHHYIFQKDNYKANELAKETLKQIEEME